jgi:preprotein translocase subunit SecD
MYKNLRWKAITIVAVAVLAAVSFYPPKDKIKLGLDLQGGVHLVLMLKLTKIAILLSGSC